MIFTFTICTPLLKGHDAEADMGMTWGAGHPRSSPCYYSRHTLVRFLSMVRHFTYCHDDYTVERRLDSVATDTTNRHLGYSHTQSVPNHFRTNQGPSYISAQTGHLKSAVCECGQQQTIQQTRVHSKNLKSICN